MKKTYQFIYLKLKHIVYLGKTYPRHFIVRILTINCFLNLFLCLTTIVSVHKVFFSFALLSVACVIFVSQAMVEEHLRKNKEFFVVKNKRRIVSLSNRRKRYLLEKKPNISFYIEAPWRKLYILWLVLSIPATWQVFELPNIFGVFFFITDILFILFILYSHYVVIKAYKSLPMEFQYIRIRWFYVFKKKSLKKLIYKVQAFYYQKIVETNLFANIVVIVIIIVSIDISLSYLLNLKPYSTCFLSYWTKIGWYYIQFGDTLVRKNFQHFYNNIKRLL